MKEIICNLINQKREGDWWDFKQEHHKKITSLLHDILCLSNVLYEGNRYLIYGVNDSFEIIGVDEGETRRTQADIISYLNTQSFAFHHIPSIELHSIKINGKTIDVVVIKNCNHKPFFLTKNVNKDGVKIQAGTIYSRFSDVNTAKDLCANPYEIEAMWRQRFGLDKKASDRFINVLLDVANWKYDGIDSAFYDVDPDFTIKIESKNEAGGEYWWEKKVLEEPPRKASYHLKYKGVILHDIVTIFYKSENLKIVSPEIEHIAYPDGQYTNNQDSTKGNNVSFHCDLCYYIKGTVQHSLLQHIQAIESNAPNVKPVAIPIESQFKSLRIKLPFPVFNCKDEAKEKIYKITEKLPVFLDSVESKIASCEKADLEKEFSQWACCVAVQNT